MLILRVGTIPLRANEALMLHHARMSAEHCATGREALEFLRLYDYDLMLIDLELSDMPGHEAIRLARAAGLSTPSIVLAETATPAIRAKVLDSGADDFVMMPCDPDEQRFDVVRHIRKLRREFLFG